MKVSIIVPYLKDRGYLDEALDSVKNQTYDDIQLIMSQSDANVSTNFNNGLTQVEGELVRYLCDDDMLTPNSVADTVRFFQENPSVDFIQSNAYNMFPDHTEEYVPKHKVPTIDNLLTHYIIHGGTVTYRKKCFEYRQMDTSLWTGEEYDLNMWLIGNNYKIGYLDSFTYIYRRHPEQKSLGIRDPEYIERRKRAKAEIRNRYLSYGTNVKK